jgi:hypothetical protein
MTKIKFKFSHSNRGPQGKDLNYHRLVQTKKILNNEIMQMKMILKKSKIIILIHGPGKTLKASEY